MQTEPELLAFDGVLGLRSIAALHAHLLQAMTGRTAIRIDCTNAESVDASVIQLLLAARRSAERDNVALDIAAPPDGALHRALMRCGLPADALCGPTQS
jgi:ABC-type transporter Mla MlaB component